MISVSEDDIFVEVCVIAMNDFDGEAVVLLETSDGLAVGELCTEGFG